MTRPISRAVEREIIKCLKAGIWKSNSIQVVSCTIIHGYLDWYLQGLQIGGCHSCTSLKFNSLYTLLSMPEITVSERLINN